MDHATFLDLLADRFADHPDAPYARFLETGEVDGPTLTWRWSDLDRATAAIAAALRERCEVGDRALIACPPGLDFIAAFLGCLRAGIVAVPVAPPVPVWLMRNVLAVRAIARDAKPAAVLTTHALTADLSEVYTHAPEVASLPWIVADRLATSAPPPIPTHTAAPDDIAFLQYTSGSTGQPKGVIVRHRNLLANQRAIAEGFGHRPGEPVGVCWLPLFHDMGLIGAVLHPIFLDSPMSTFLTPTHFLRKPVRWLRAISEGRHVTSGGPDFAYALCCDRVTDKQLEGLDLSGWAVAYSGAEQVDPRTLDRFAARFGPVGFRRERFLPCYGLAEATLMVSGARLTERAPRVEIAADGRGIASAGEPGICRVSCGRPAEGHEVSIVDPNTHDRLPDGTAGAIWVRGPSVASGYWGREPFANVRADGEGPFLDTGDLGLIDEHGGVVVTGRARAT